MVLKIVKGILNLPDLEKTVKDIKKDVKVIRENLIKLNLLEPVTKSDSMKQITERGYDLLHRYSIEPYIISNCDILKDKTIKEKKDIEIYMECLKWVKTKGKKKVIEISLNNNLSESQCNELLSLAIMEKIKSI